MKMPPNKRTIEVPPGGWKERRLYLVDVAFSKYSAIYRAVFYSGCLDGNKSPGKGNAVWAPEYDRVFHLHDMHYLKAIETLVKHFDQE